MKSLSNHAAATPATPAAPPPTGPSDSVGAALEPRAVAPAAATTTTAMAATSPQPRNPFDEPGDAPAPAAASSGVGGGAAATGTLQPAPPQSFEEFGDALAAGVAAGGNRPRTSTWTSGAEAVSSLGAQAQPQPLPLTRGASTPPVPSVGGCGDRGDTMASFDPLLASSTQAQRGQAGGPRQHRGVFGAPGADGGHPLLAGNDGGDADGANVERKNPFDDFDLFAANSPLPSSSSRPPRHGARGRHRQTQSLCLPSEFSSLAAPSPAAAGAASIDPSLAASELKSLASQLSAAKPRALNEEEKAEEAKMIGRLTLGEEPKESTGTKKSHPRKTPMGSLRKHVKGAVRDGISVVRDPRNIREIAHRHRKSASMDANALGGIVNEVNDAGGGTRAAGKEGKARSTGIGFGSSLALTPKAASMRKMMGLAGAEGPGAPPLTPTQSHHNGKGRRGGGHRSGSNTPTGRGTQSPKMPASAGGTPNSCGAGGSSRPVLSLGPPGSAAGGERPRLSPVLSGGIACGGDGAGDLPPPPPPPPPYFPDLAAAAAASESYASACSYAPSSDVPSMRSSEQDPAPHQVEIPSIDDFLMHARACSVLDSYRVVDQNFDFGALVGMSRMGLEGFVSPVSVDDDDDDDDGDGAGDAAGGTASMRSYRGQAKDGAMLVETAHRPIVSSILGCADDLVVEGFFHEVGGAGTSSANSSRHGPAADEAEDDTGTARDKATNDRVEAAIFYSHRRRQFVVAWRGTTADQVKPVRNRHVRAWREASPKMDGRGNLAGPPPGGTPVTVFPPFRDSYLGCGLEDRVFRLLDELTDRSPFCDVVMTGHSFGAALAALSAVRFASARPMMRVLCQAFGCPRVGDAGFRRWANSLPNLRMMRVEYGGDPWVGAPEGAPWTHAGHGVVVDGSAVMALAAEREDGRVDGGGKSMRSAVSGMAALPVRAYRFDRHRPSEGSGRWINVAVGQYHGKGEKMDRELRTYVGALERIASLGLPWPRDYVGQDVGKGVKGSGKEKRLVV